MGNAVTILMLLYYVTKCTSDHYISKLGSIDLSPDGNKLAIAQGNLMLYDFNTDLGAIANPLILDKNFYFYYYGVCFSPDNTKLYASTGGPLQQFDLSLKDTNNIITSKTLIANVEYPALKRGPDRKVYCGNPGQSSLNVINRPDLAGTPCQFVANGFPLSSANTRSGLGLPNSVTIVASRKIYRFQTDTLFCVNQFLLTAIDTSGMNYVWENNRTGQSQPVSSSGTYWVSYEVHSPCMYYVWEEGSVGKQRKVNKPGIYWLSYQLDSLCENHIDSFIITYPDPDYKVSFSADTLACITDLISFQNTSDRPFNNFNWSFGDQEASVLQNPRYAYSHSGSYRVMLVGHIDDICPDTAYQNIVVDTAIFAHFLIDRDSICTGEMISFSLNSGNTATSLHWQFGDGATMTSGNQDKTQHAYETTGVLPVTLTSHFRVCPDTFFMDTVYVHSLPLVDLGPDPVICLHGASLILQNLQPHQTGFHYGWNTGDTSRQFKVVHPGHYSLTVTSAHDCAVTESVRVDKDCYLDMPNAFTPNGDGINDYFFSRPLLFKDAVSFRLQVFNRWGQLLFETTSTDGRGWDGRFNNRDQPAGVYVYLVEIGFDNGRQERYKGNVTLLR